MRDKYRERWNKADKFTFITEYVLQKFEEGCRRFIIHDMNLRLWALEAKDQVDLSEFKASKFGNSRICIKLFLAR